MIKGFLEANGILLEPWQLAVWAIPTALFALVIHGARLIRLDRTIARETEQEGGR